MLKLASERHSGGAKNPHEDKISEKVIDEALVDAYGEAEQVTGFYTMLENDLRLPFDTQILGVTARVEGVDITEDDQLVRRLPERQGQATDLAVRIAAALALPEGTEWIVAYRY